MSRTHIDINFSPKDAGEQKLYERIIKTRKGISTIAEHARQLLQAGLDATTGASRRGKR